MRAEAGPSSTEHVRPDRVRVQRPASEPPPVLVRVLSDPRRISRSRLDGLPTLLARGGALPQQGFAIIDVETTAFDGRGTDRVVEVAVVHADVDGRVTGVWDTLVNPGRDVGATRIHAGDVMRAPTFAQIAPRLVQLLASRVLEAHNAAFDTRFLGGFNRSSKHRLFGVSVGAR